MELILLITLYLFWVLFFLKAFYFIYYSIRLLLYFFLTISVKFFSLFSMFYILKAMLFFNIIVLVNLIRLIVLCLTWRNGWCLICQKGSVSIPLWFQSITREFIRCDPLNSTPFLLIFHTNRIKYFNLFILNLYNHKQSNINLPGFWGFGEIGRASCRERV